MKTQDKMSMPDNQTLLRLSDTNLSPANLSQDIRGRKVIDAKGEEIGHVDDLFVDAGEKKVRFLQIAAGGFLGMGETKFLVPVDTVTKVEKEIVRIDRDRHHVASSPPFDPKLVNKPYLDDLYRYYGYAPFWTMGYTYPPFPYVV